MNLIEQGAFPLSAARAIGIPRRTWYTWLADERDDSPTLALRHAVERARGRLAVKLYATIHSAAIGHEEAARDSKGNVVMIPNEKGQMVPMMVMVPGNAMMAVRILESLSPDEFLRNTTGSGVAGGQGDGDMEGATPFEIVYITSNRDAKELREIEKRVAERAGRA